MRTFVGSFYVSIFLSMLTIGHLTPADILSISERGGAETLITFCQSFTTIWIIVSVLFISLSIMTSRELSLAADSIRSIFQKLFAKWKSNRLHSYLLMAGLGLAISALSACASNSDREIQHDPSGTDLPLKSPCACTQVPYSAPSYLWVG